MLWGSVSKPVAAAVVKHLAGEGTLDPAAPADSYVPGAPNVPVSALLDHTSGLGFGAGHLDVDGPDATAMDVVGEMSGETGESGATGEHRYSSLGYLHLQAVIEAATGGTPTGTRSARRRGCATWAPRPRIAPTSPAATVWPARSHGR